MSDAPAEVCANCAIESSDAVKLKDCTACRLVKYCSVECQKAHRKQHKKACKLRAAELKDEELYGQGHERPDGDLCSICTLPIPLPTHKHSITKACCAMTLCDGCQWALMGREMYDCPFCRTPIVWDNSVVLAELQKRVDAKDPYAINLLASQNYGGGYGLEKVGAGVAKSKAKGLRHFEAAAMQGHALSRFNLGLHEFLDGNCGRALRHFMISAKMGHSDSINAFRDPECCATREQYDEGLKGYLAAVEETKSPERDHAAKMNAEYGGSDNMISLGPHQIAHSYFKRK
ncbi:hypothetical protein THAOC_32904 [Thalassiosira oceanica]|uniref:MYND-type domain-containing protein n=1 Tax=Thalassiosira oceanica TaxID=159749 RepID=K0RHB3_THAOC|nr:hypothetical protein THAOC_32904 [Thalassiosira oceanica]|eukprot:EJK48311.1 hypothetical protein THAOC_32904 [Thalassiosira oceanica]